MPEKNTFYLCGAFLRTEFERSQPNGHLLFLSKLKQYRRVNDARDAQILVAVEHPASMRELWQHATARHLRLFLAGEAFFPNFNSFDYAYGFDHLELSDRYIRLHPTARFQPLFSPKTVRSGLDLNPFDREFCDFIYSNPRAHPARDAFFRLLSGYREVTSLGRHLNSGDTTIQRRGSPNEGTWLSQKLKAQAHFKFSIAFENARYHGYTSEKILTSLFAGQVPIYWGNPGIALDFNPERFIDVHSFESFELAIEAVRVVDEDPKLWLEMVRKPFYTAKQLKEIEYSGQKVELFLKNIFMNGQSGISRRGIGTFPDFVEKAQGRLVNGSKFRSRITDSIRSIVPAGLRHWIKNWFRL